MVARAPASTSVAKAATTTTATPADDPRNIQAAATSLHKYIPLALAQVYVWLVVLPEIVRPHWEQFWVSQTPLQSSLVMNSFGFVAFPVFGIMMQMIYRLQWPFFEQFKISDKRWPWLGDEVTRDAFRKLSVSSVWYYLFNNVVLIPALTVASDKVFRVETPHLDAAWPSVGSMLVQNVMLTVVHEFFFYWSHRILHLPRLYRWHKVHHQYRDNNILAAQHNHPIDYIISLISPAILTVVIVRPSHSIIRVQWMVWLLYANYDDHCGYSFPWSPVRWFPLASLTDHHEFHHSRNVGCFSSKLSAYDKAFGSEHHYLTWKAKRPVRGANWFQQHVDSAEKKAA